MNILVNSVPLSFLFFLFNAHVSKGWFLCPLRSERGIILQIMLPQRFKIIPEQNDVICTLWHKHVSVPQRVVAFRGETPPKHVILP